MSYIGNQKTVAEIDFGIYNWKQHSTPFLIKWMRELSLFHDWDNRYSEEELQWEDELEQRIRDELATRPHWRKKNKNK